MEKRIAQVKQELTALPEGKLICAQGNNCYKWYVSDGHHKTYLPKRERRLAEQLAYKKYLTLLLEEMEHEKMAISFYLRHHSSGRNKFTHLLKEQAGYRELLSPHFKSASQELSDWMQTPYEKNLNYPEYLIHETIDGNFVRSKSEAMIYHALYLHKIPFRYECALTVGGETYYPDFTILHPRTGKTYYWEHCGRMDDENYSQRVFSKLHSFNVHGIMPGVQLIVTYESGKYPLRQFEIEEIIEKYFL
ncbi:MAG: ATPase [Lachnospiraceae bacterium]|nr:ATPase [Lachnospiraceae bacterium]